MGEYTIVKQYTDHNVISNKHFLKFAKNIYSQNGEDGILQEIFNNLKIEDGLLVEFGAHDGIWCSNTYNLWRYNPNFKSILIEREGHRFEQLKEYFKRIEHVECINKEVSYNKDDANSIDNILEKSKFNNLLHNLVLISIDVDSCDYYMLASLTKHLPKAIIIETDTSHDVNTEFYSYDKGCSLKSINDLAKSKNYKLICHTGNAIFVRNDLVNLLPDSDYSIENLYCSTNLNTSYLQRMGPEGKLTGNHYYNSQECLNRINSEKMKCL